MHSHYSDRPNSSKFNAPSVPMSVYRQLVAELQTTQAELESVKNQNKQLHRHNQRLRKDVKKLVRTAQNLEQMLTVTETPVNSSLPIANSVGEIHAPKVKEKMSFKMSYDSPKIETIGEHSYNYPQSRASSHSVHGWFVFITVIVIVMTAFGTGFFLMRPWIDNSDNEG